MKSTHAGSKDPLREQAIQATVLVAELLDSRRLGKFHEAQEAQADLKRLGIEIRFCPPRPVIDRGSSDGR